MAPALGWLKSTIADHSARIRSTPVFRDLFIGVAISEGLRSLTEF
jgi:hypothetical protein